MINDYSNGGLKTIDIQSFNKSLKAMWIKKYLDSGNQGKWKLFFDLELGKSVEKTALTSNLSQQDITKTIATKKMNSFVREVLTIWAEINFEKQITSKTQFFSQSVWHNSLIRIANYPVFYPDWFNKGVKKVKDLTDDSDNFLSFNEFQIKVNLKACPLKYYGLLSALKSLGSTCQNHSNNNSVYESFSSKILKPLSGSRLIYKKLLSSKCITPPYQKQMA